MNIAKYKSNSLLVMPIFVKDLYLAKTAVEECSVNKIGLYWIMQIRYKPSSKEETKNILRKLDKQDNVISVDFIDKSIVAEFVADKSKDFIITIRMSCGYTSLSADDIVEFTLYWKSASYEVVKCLKEKTQAINDSLGLFF